MKEGRKKEKTKKQHICIVSKREGVTVKTLQSSKVSKTCKNKKRKENGRKRKLGKEKNGKSLFNENFVFIIDRRDFVTENKREEKILKERK